MTRFTIAIALSLAAGSCAPSTHATAYRPLAPKTSADQIEVFTGTEPTRPYEEVGAIEVAAADLSNSHYGDLIERARTKAAEMGADAIIVTRDPQSRSTGLAYVPPAKKKSGQVVTGTSRSIDTPRIQVAAIVWKGGASR